MEFWLLAKVGMIINSIVYSGYAVAGGYIVKTGIRYFQDYKEAIARDEVE